MRRLLCLLALVFASCEPKEPADTVLVNGKVVTLDSAGRISEAIAIRGGRILAVGTTEEILAYAGSKTERVELGGKIVVPGFADNHYHSIGGGPGVDLSRTRTLQEVLDRIAARARETPEGEIVVTNSDWHEGQLAEQRLPYRDDLDRASPRHPVVVVRGGHEYILNSAALARFGIEESVQAPEGGSVGRYLDGRLNGELVDAAKSLVKLPPGPELSAEERLEALATEYHRLNQAGLTSIRYASASSAFYRELEQFKKLGPMPLRVSVLLRVQDTADLENLDIAPEAGDEWLRVAGIKLGVDGGFEGGLTREPYEEPWGRRGTFYGLQTIPTEPYVELVRALNRKGWRVATHAVGDAAIDLVLDAYEKANEDSSIVDRRFAIEHGFIPRQDQLPRMKALGVHLAAQNHLYLAAPSLVKYWGASRARWVTPLRAYLDAGIPVSLGTDAPVVPYPPLWVLYHFVTRDTLSAGVMGEDQRVSREEALRAMTLGGAALTFEETERGTVEPGKVADLVVLEEDILTCPPERVRDMAVALTMVGGWIVYRGSEPSTTSR
jgi:hypothetical protein